MVAIKAVLKTLFISKLKNNSERRNPFLLRRVCSVSRVFHRFTQVRKKIHVPFIIHYLPYLFNKQASSNLWLLWFFLLPIAQKKHIEEIQRRKFSIGGKPNPLIEDLHQAVKNLAGELYTTDAHFLMELIQVKNNGYQTMKHRHKHWTYNVDTVVIKKNDITEFNHMCRTQDT